jgi:hypothetical protein
VSFVSQQKLITSMAKVASVKKVAQRSTQLLQNCAAGQTTEEFDKDTVLQYCQYLDANHQIVDANV